MYIIVVGGGRLGYYLLKALLNEGHEVLVLEKDARICKTITDELGSVCFRGDGCEAATLAEVGTGRADMFVAVTGDDEDNLVACQVAKHKHNVPRTIARLRNPQNAVLFKKLGVDVTISTTDIILEAIEREVPTHAITELMTLDEKGLVIVDVRITPESATVGKMVKELSLPKESKLALVIPHEGSTHVPAANTVLQAGDQIIAVTSPESKEALKAALSGN
ncbi:MAG TPA: TrkA family potassium uptake protein [Dehalococcoidales bacterium]|nr:TrkA family potassium uptake protein [Dehalococcoidales bacterium]